MKMKKTILITALMLATLLCHSQMIQLKKGILSKDDVALGKLEGKATLLNGTDISIQSMDGSQLVHIKDPNIKFGYPFQEPVHFYTVEFTPINKRVCLFPETKNRFFTSEKKLVDFMFDKIGDFVNQNGLDEQVIDKFISERDQCKKINEDTIRNGKILRAGVEKLKDPLLRRPGSESLKIKAFGKETIDVVWSITYQVFEVSQGGVVIGRMSKKYTGDPSIMKSGSQQSRDVHYIVQRKVEPFTVDGASIDYIDLASIKSSTTGPDVYTRCNVGLQGFKPSDIYTAEYEIASWLISKGCL
jgi:hypothetical protein